MCQFLPPATKFRQVNVFTPVCDSIHRGSLCPGGSVEGVSPGGSALSREGSLSGRSPYGNVRAVHFLLECILVFLNVYYYENLLHLLHGYTFADSMSRKPKSDSG